eukprot:m.1564361 g.1564361  ORF g.1564361 m.1564361 type:complete len:2726 (+) comp25284_c0_seq7:271-8448(+)
MRNFDHHRRWWTVCLLTVACTDIYLARAQNLTTSSTTTVSCNATSMTDRGVPCVFPFTYQGRSFDACTKFDDVLGRYWCATRTTSRTDDTMRAGSWAHCACENPVDLSSCPYRRNGFCYPNGCDTSGDAYVFVNSTNPADDTCVPNASPELLALRFNGQTALSHLITPANVGFRQSVITFRFRTTTPNGMLVFASASAASSQDASLPVGGPSPNYFYCLLKNGVVNFGFRIASMRLFEPVNSDVNLIDGAWHAVSILRHDTVVMVTIDDEEPSTFTSIDGSEYFISSSVDEMLVATIYLGEWALSPHLVPSTVFEGAVPFDGCLQRVFVDGTAINTASADTTVGVDICTMASCAPASFDDCPHGGACPILDDLEPPATTAGCTCPSSCEQCTVDGQCILCSNTTLLFPSFGVCVEACPGGYVEAAQPSGGALCVPDASYDGRGVMGCATDNAEGASCQRCSPDGQRCEQCKFRRYLLDGRCIDSCPAPYENRGQGTYNRWCRGPCNSGRGCTTCSTTDPTTCASCARTWVLHRGVCLQACPTGTSDVDGTCVAPAAALPCSVDPVELGAGNINNSAFDLPDYPWPTVDPGNTSCEFEQEFGFLVGNGTIGWDFTSRVPGTRTQSSGLSNGGRLGQWAWAFSGGGLTQTTESLVDSNLTYTLDVLIGTELPGFQGGSFVVTLRDEHVPASQAHGEGSVLVDATNGVLRCSFAECSSATSASCGPVATWVVPLLHQSDCPSLSRRPSCRIRLTHRFNTTLHPTSPTSRVAIDLQGFSSSEGEIVTFDDATLAATADACDCDFCNTDILFVIDTSGSIDDDASYLEVIASVVSRIDMDRTKVAAIAYSDRPFIAFDFNAHRSVTSLIDGVRTIRPTRNRPTAIGKALNFSAEFLRFDASSGWRGRAGNTSVVLVSDGLTWYENETNPDVFLARREALVDLGVRLYAIQIPTARDHCGVARSCTDGVLDILSPSDGQEPVFSRGLPPMYGEGVFNQSTIADVRTKALCCQQRPPDPPNACQCVCRNCTTQTTQTSTTFTTVSSTTTITTTSYTPTTTTTATATETTTTSTSTFTTLLTTTAEPVCCDLEVCCGPLSCRNDTALPYVLDTCASYRGFADVANGVSFGLGLSTTVAAVVGSPGDVLEVVVDVHAWPGYFFAGYRINVYGLSPADPFGCGEWLVRQEVVQRSPSAVPPVDPARVSRTLNGTYVGFRIMVQSGYLQELTATQFGTPTLSVCPQCDLSAAYVPPTQFCGTYCEKHVVIFLDTSGSTNVVWGSHMQPAALRTLELLAPGTTALGREFADGIRVSVYVQNDTSSSTASTRIGKPQRLPGTTYAELKSTIENFSPERNLRTFLELNVNTASDGGSAADIQSDQDTVILAITDGRTFGMRLETTQGVNRRRKFFEQMGKFKTRHPRACMYELGVGAIDADVLGLTPTFQNRTVEEAYDSLQLSDDFPFPGYDSFTDSWSGSTLQCDEWSRRGEARWLSGATASNDAINAVVESFVSDLMCCDVDCVCDADCFTPAPTTASPTAAPSDAPTLLPTLMPTRLPTYAPTTAPTWAPTETPTTLAPTAAPTINMCTCAECFGCDAVPDVCDDVTMRIASTGAIPRIYSAFSPAGGPATLLEIEDQIGRATLLDTMASALTDEEAYVQTSGGYRYSLRFLTGLSDTYSYSGANVSISAQAATPWDTYRFMCPASYDGRAAPGSLWPLYNAGRQVVASSPWTTGVEGIRGAVNLSVRLQGNEWEEQDMVLFARMRICREAIACSVTPLVIPQPNLNIVVLIDASGSVDNSEFGIALLNATASHLTVISGSVAATVSTYYFSDNLRGLDPVFVDVPMCHGSVTDAAQATASGCTLVADLMALIRAAEPPYNPGTEIGWTLSNFGPTIIGSGDRTVVMVTDGDVGHFESDRDFQLGVLAFKAQLRSTPQDTCFRVAASEPRAGQPTNRTRLDALVAQLSGECDTPLPVYAPGANSTDYVGTFFARYIQSTRRDCTCPHADTCCDSMCPMAPDGDAPPTPCPSPPPATLSPQATPSPQAMSTPPPAISTTRAPHTGSTLAPTGSPVGITSPTQPPTLLPTSMPTTAPELPCCSHEECSYCSRTPCSSIAVANPVFSVDQVVAGDNLFVLNGPTNWTYERPPNFDVAFPYSPRIVNQTRGVALLLPTENAMMLQTGSVVQTIVPPTAAAPTLGTTFTLTVDVIKEQGYNFAGFSIGLYHGLELLNGTRVNYTTLPWHTLDFSQRVPITVTAVYDGQVPFNGLFIRIGVGHNFTSRSDVDVLESIHTLFTNVSLCMVEIEQQCKSCLLDRAETDTLIMVDTSGSSASRVPLLKAYVQNMTQALHDLAQSQPHEGDIRIAVLTFSRKIDTYIPSVSARTGLAALHAYIDGIDATTGNPGTAIGKVLQRVAYSRWRGLLNISVTDTDKLNIYLLTDGDYGETVGPSEDDASFYGRSATLFDRQGACLHVIPPVNPTAASIPAALELNFTRLSHLAGDIRGKPLCTLPPTSATFASLPFTSSVADAPYLSNVLRPNLDGSSTFAFDSAIIEGTVCRQDCTCAGDVCCNADAAFPYFTGEFCYFDSVPTSTTTTFSTATSTLSTVSSTTFTTYTETSETSTVTTETSATDTSTTTSATTTTYTTSTATTFTSTTTLDLEQCDCDCDWLRCDTGVQGVRGACTSVDVCPQHASCKMAWVWDRTDAPQCIFTCDAGFRTSDDGQQCVPRTTMTPP